MTDTEFANYVDGEVGEYYSKARNAFSLGLPEYGLSSLRSMVNVVCNKFLAMKGISCDEESLSEKITILRKRKILNPDLIDRLHGLRVNGNKGAHPEDSKLTPNALLELCEASIKAASGLTQDLALQIPGKQLKEFHFQTLKFSDYEFKEQSIKALFDDDSQCQYEMGLALQEKQKLLDRTLKNEAEENNLSIVDLKPVHRIAKKAYSFFEMASENRHSDALYQVGLAKIEGFACVKDIAGGEYDLYVSANDGCIEAKAAFGIILLQGGDYFEQDIDRAIENLAEAAKHDNPLALKTLADLHRLEGRYELAYENYRIASEAGFLQADIAIAELKFEGVLPAVEMDIPQALEKAVNERWPRALRLMGLVKLEAHNQSSLDEAINFLREFCSLEGTSESYLEVVNNLLERDLQDSHLVSVVHLICEGYRILPEGSTLSNKVLKTCKRVHKKLKASLSKKVSLSDEELIALMQFKSDGTPFSHLAEGAIELGKLEQSRNGVNDREIDRKIRKIAGTGNRPFISNKIGPNEPCPCGSDKKYKKCCRQ